MRRLSWYYKFLLFNLRIKIDIDKKLLIENSSLNSLFNLFGSDKGTSTVNPYSKNSNELVGHGFGDHYEKKFNFLKEEKFNLLEIGTWEGASLASFDKYFKNANIYGLDRNFKLKYKSKRIHFNFCDTRDLDSLSKFENKIRNNKFKVIIDDGSHLLTDMIHNLKFFFKFLDNDGYYVVEDYNHPRYFTYLNDSNQRELFFDQIIENFKKKNYFDSRILSKSDQDYLHKNIKTIDVKKGFMINNKENISDLVFFKKN